MESKWYYVTIQCILMSGAEHVFSREEVVIVICVMETRSRERTYVLDLLETCGPSEDKYSLSISQSSSNNKIYI